MKTPTVLMALAFGLGATAAAEAQLFRRGSAPNPRSVPAPRPIPSNPAEGGTPASAPGTRTAGDADVKPSNFVVPDPTNPKDLPASNIPLPAEPIEPYLLTQENGPFMVMAHTFKGQNSDKYAQILAMELRSQFGLPAYVFRPKDFPMRSMIRGVPPTAAPGVNRPMISFPEAERVKDEAAVLVGNEKTLEDAARLAHKVKKIRPACLNTLPDWHGTLKTNGLKTAIQTTNPYAPAEVLFPRKPDVMIQKINQGPHSIYTCPGRYSLQVAEFHGLSSYDVDARKAQGHFTNMLELKRSPLATAHDDAERMAAALARDDEVRQTGYVPYVYHDRYSSKVMIGAFNSPSDPAAVKLRDSMLKMATSLLSKKISGTMIAPATSLTDLSEIKRR